MLGLLCLMCPLRALCLRIVPVVPVVLVTYACECSEMACFGKGVFLMGLASERAR